MLQHRRNSSLAALLLVVSACCSALSLLLPLFTFALGGLKAGPLTMNPTVTVHLMTTPIRDVVGACALIVVLAGLLLLVTHRRGVGLLWRAVGLLATLVMCAVSGRLWFEVADPATLMRDSIFAPTDRMGAGLSALHLINLHAAAGMWILTFGAISGLIGCLTPSAKSRRLVLDQSDLMLWRHGYGI